MSTLHTGCGREVHHGGCTCREGAEIARLKAEVERLAGELTDADQVTRDALGHARAGWEGERKRLEADLAAHKLALAAGPAALRRRYSKYEAGIVKSAYEDAAQVVEAAQKRAMLKQGGG